MGPLCLFSSPLSDDGHHLINLSSTRDALFGTISAIQDHERNESIIQLSDCRAEPTATKLS